MMRFLSHRGYWLQPAEQNTRGASSRALHSGFGIETDLRDAGGELVISHGPPGTEAWPAEDLFSQWAAQPAPLALNIKADGLCALLRPLLERYRISDYFCFDMSVPEALAYRCNGLRYFTRESEYEPHPPLYDSAAGVWMDMFQDDWIGPGHIARHLAAAKQVAIVSPELHHRPHEPFWARLREAGLARHSGVLLCTDLPADARDYFHV